MANDASSRLPVPGLRSPYARVGRIVHFGRMLDKIRLHAEGKLPEDYCDNLGQPRPNLFDARCCRFLGIAYADLRVRTLAGATDEVLVAWAEANGKPRNDEECLIWNRFMMKLGWRDDRSAFLQQRIAQVGLSDRTIETFFDLIDYEEGRDPMVAQPWNIKPRMAIVLMGVAGSGKTTIGQALSAALGWPFRDADDFHPAANIAKMSAGIALNDEDRVPWLAAIRKYLDETLAANESAIVTCSALKEIYRETLSGGREAVKWIYLKGSPELLLERLKTRQGHFMKPEMLHSQLATLEEPKDALVLDVAEEPAAIVARVRAGLGI